MFFIKTTEFRLKIVKKAIFPIRKIKLKIEFRAL